MKNKKIIILSLISVIIFSFSFCYAENTTTNKSGDLFDSARQYWNTTVEWFNKDAKPWIDDKMTPEAKDEYKQRFKDFISRISEGFKELMDKIGQVFK